MSRNHRSLLWLILLAYGMLGISYGLATPPLESSDEYKHFPFVQYVQTERRLPVLDPEYPGLWLQEGAQPPLYYLLMASVIAGIDTSDLPEIHQLNPQAFIGNPNQLGNKNLIIHDPQREAFPWSGSILAIYVIRAASLLLGAGTILTTARLGHRLFTARIGLFAAALTAFNPMFLFVSAAVNNDSLAMLLGTLGLFLLVRLWQDAPDPGRAWWRYLALGFVLGLGVLTKLSLGGLLGLTGLSLAWLSWRSRDWRLLFGGGLLVLSAFLLVSGAWFLRNWQLYGDLTGLNAFVAVQGTRDMPLTWAGWVSEFGTFYRSFWGLFGGVNVAAPQLFYFLLNGAFLLGLAGLLRWIWSPAARKEFIQSGAWLLLVWVLVLFLLLIRWTMISPAFQGRLIFPALGAFNILWALGLLAWFPPGWQRRIAFVFSGALLFAALLLPWLTIRPAYAAPEVLDAVPMDAQISPVTFQASDGKLQLVGVAMQAGQRVTPDGGPVFVTLYWRAAEPVAADYISSVHLLGRQWESVGQIDRYPAMGMIPTSRWQEGDIYRDDYRIMTRGSIAAPAALRVAVSLYDDRTDRVLPATGGQDLLLDPLIVGEPVRLTAAEQELPALDTRLDIPFAQGITLSGYELGAAHPGETVPITLYWQAAQTPDRAYTVFVHLLDQNGQRIAGADGPPVNNFFPTTFWQAGDVIDDVHMLSVPAGLPAGEYQVLVGLYDPASGLRLARADSGGDSVSLPLFVQQANR